jgi:hypothetical protein
MIHSAEGRQEVACLVEDRSRSMKSKNRLSSAGRTKVSIAARRRWRKFRTAKASGDRATARKHLGKGRRLAR